MGGAKTASLPKYVVVRPQYDYQVLKSHLIGDASDNARHDLSNSNRELIADAIVDAYFKSEQANQPWTWLQLPRMPYSSSERPKVVNDQSGKITKSMAETFRTIPISAPSYDITRDVVQEMLTQAKIATLAKDIDTILQHYGLPRSYGWD